MSLFSRTSETITTVITKQKLRPKQIKSRMGYQPNPEEARTRGYSSIATKLAAIIVVAVPLIGFHFESVSSKDAGRRRIVCAERHRLSNFK